jgi:hypothetical protein
MQSIGTNSIRVYHVNPYADHDGCMAAFDNAGIYVWLDLDTFSTQINQSAPTWETDQFLAFAEVMDVFQKYDNLAGFWIGNEVINTETGSIAAPYIKAATTDMKSYMADKSYRQIPIGYSAADIAELRPMLQNYLACGSQPNQIIDFFGLNSYEWCGDATYQSSGYENLQAMSEGYNIPIFFSETGCIIPAPRTFADQAAIFGPDMIDTWSGAIIYEWVQEVNDYGLVTYPNGQIYSGAPIPLQPDYNNLANQWKNINPTGVSEASYSPSLSPPACPVASGGWNLNGDVPLPTLPAGVVANAAANPQPTTSTSPSAPTTITTSSIGIVSTSLSTSVTALADSVSSSATHSTSSSVSHSTPFLASHSASSSSSSGSSQLSTISLSSASDVVPHSSSTLGSSSISRPSLSGFLLSQFRARMVPTGRIKPRPKFNTTAGHTSESSSTSTSKATDGEAAATGTPTNSNAASPTPSKSAGNKLAEPDLGFGAAIGLISNLGGFGGEIAFFIVIPALLIGFVGFLS